MFVSFRICQNISLAVFQQKIFYILVGFIKNLSCLLYTSDAADE